MYLGSFEHGKIIEAFTRNVPGSYVRDYRANGGYITICKNYRDIKWRDQVSAPKVERQIPATTLCNLPRGNMTAATKYNGLRLTRPGWRIEFRRAMQHISRDQMKAIEKCLGVDGVFVGEQ